MKFFCNRCQTKYSIADEKVRGKVLKVRCKTCSNVIEVREPVTTGPLPVAATASTPEALSRAFDQAFVGNNEESTLADARLPALSPRPSQQGIAPPALPPQSLNGQAAPPIEEWFYGQDGQQFGPLTFDGLSARLAEAPPAAEILVWRDGMDDWLPPAEVPELKPHLPKRSVTPRATPPGLPAQSAPAPKEDAPAPAPSTGLFSEEGLFATPAKGNLLDDVAERGEDGAHADFSGGGGPGGMEDLVPRAPGDDLLIGEASRIVRLSPAMLDAVGQRPQRRTIPTAPLPGLGGKANTGKERAITGQGTLPPGAAGDLATQAPSTEPDANGQGADASMSQSTDLSAVRHVHAVQQAHQKRMRGGVAIALAAGALLTAILVIALWPREEERDSDKFGSDHLSGLQIDEFGRVIERKSPNGISISGTGAATTKPVDPGKKPLIGTPGTKPVGGPTAASTTAVGLPPLPTHDDGEKGLNFGTPGQSGSAPTNNAPEKAIGVIRDGQMGVKACYERAMKQDPSLKTTRRVDLTVKISADGAVKTVGLGSAPSSLGSCIDPLVRRWRFPKSPTDYKVEFPLIFSGG